MKYALFVLCLMAFSMDSISYAQESEPDYGPEIVQTIPSEAVETAITEAHTATAEYLYSESFGSLVAPRRCLRREFLIPRTVSLERADMILRIERGECLLPHPYFVHNPTTRRIYLIEESEALRLLNAITGLMAVTVPEQ